LSNIPSDRDWERAARLVDMLVERAGVECVDMLVERAGVESVECSVGRLPGELMILGRRSIGLIDALDRVRTTPSMPM